MITDKIINLIEQCNKYINNTSESEYDQQIRCS